jgi:integral membrane sensor domain MASE1
MQEKERVTITKIAKNRDVLTYTVQTLRATAIVSLLAAFVLYSKQMGWAVMPMLLGSAMGMLLLIAWGVFIPRFLGPTEGSVEESVKGNEKKIENLRLKRLLFLFALIKYPLVGVLLFFVARRMTILEVAAFVGGYLILHLVILLRALGKHLTAA